MNRQNVTAALDLCGQHGGALTGIESIMPHCVHHAGNLSVLQYTTACTHASLVKHSLNSSNNLIASSQAHAILVAQSTVSDLGMRPSVWSVILHLSCLYWAPHHKCSALLFTPIYGSIRRSLKPSKQLQSVQGGGETRSYQGLLIHGSGVLYKFWNLDPWRLIVMQLNILLSKTEIHILVTA